MGLSWLSILFHWLYFWFCAITTLSWLLLPCSKRRQWQPTPVLLPGKFHWQRSLVGCSPWGREESGMTEQLHFHFSLSCIGEGNGNPLQCSCLENPRDRGAWWAAIYGVAPSQTQLKQLSSSSSSIVWSQEAWYLQLHFCFSRLLWLFGVICVSIQIVNFFVLILWKIPLIIWQGLHLI